MCCFCFGSSKKDYPFNIANNPNDDEDNNNEPIHQEDLTPKTKGSDFELIVENLSIKRVPKALANLIPHSASMQRHKFKNCPRRDCCHNGGKYQVPAEQLKRALLDVKNNIETSVGISEEIKKTESIQAEVYALKDQSAGPDLSEISEDDLPKGKNRPKSPVEKFLASHPQNQQKQHHKSKKASLLNKDYPYMPPENEKDKEDINIAKSSSIVMLKEHKYNSSNVDKAIFRRAANLTKSLANEKAFDNIESENQQTTAAFQKSDLKKFLTPPQFDFFSRRNIPPPKLIESNKKFKKVMSPDLKETIDSLRYSQPPKKLPGFPPRNQRTVRESSPNRITFSNPLSNTDDSKGTGSHKSRGKSALPLKRIMIPQHFDHTNHSRPVSQPKSIRPPSSPTRRSFRPYTESQVNLREHHPSSSSSTQKFYLNKRQTPDSPRRRHRSISKASRSKIYSIKDYKHMHITPKSSANGISSSKKSNSNNLKRHRSNSASRRDKSPTKSNKYEESKNKKDLKWKIIIKQHPKT